jgi:hypothetical protein
MSERKRKKKWRGRRIIGRRIEVIERIPRRISLGRISCRKEEYVVGGCGGGMEELLWNR